MAQNPPTQHLSTMPADSNTPAPEHATAHRGGRPLRRRAWVVTGYLVVALFPLRAVLIDFAGSVPITPDRSGPTNAYLTMWILSWGEQALTSNPAALFDANILYPAPAMLTGSEHMLGLLPLYAPFYALSGNPAFSLNVTLLLAFALAGTAMYALLRRWKCTTWGAAMGGLVLATSPAAYAYAPLPHLVAWLYLPLALLFLDRTFQSGRASDGTAAAVFLTLHLSCSFTVAYVSIWLVAGYLAVALPACGVRTARGRSSPAGLLLGISAVAIAGGALAFLASHYPAPVGDESGHGAALQLPEIGALPILFVALGLLPMADNRSPAAARYGILVGTILCAIGSATNGLPIATPAWTETLQPTLPAAGDPFDLGVWFGIAALSGIGFSTASRALAVSPRLQMAAVAALTMATLWGSGALQRPHRSAEIPTGRDVPEVYRRLADMPPGAVVEIPAGMDRFVEPEQESKYAYFSTYHRHPVLNGFTGFQPPTLKYVAALVNALPDVRALGNLSRTTDLRYIVLHRDRMSSLELKLWQEPRNLEVVADWETTLLLGTVRPQDWDLRPALIAAEQSDSTILGTKIVEIAEENREALLRIAAPFPTQAVPETRFPVNVSVKHVSLEMWPALAPGSDLGVQWAVRWKNLATGKTWEESNVAPLAYDMGHRQSLRQTIYPRAPRRAGEYVLTVGLTQAGEWFPVTAETDPISVRGSLRPPPKRLRI